MQCYGRNVENHCCFVNGKPCKFLEENTEPGQRWSCALMRELQSWDLVITDPRYFAGDASPGDAFKATSYVNCKNFQCKECGQLERGEISQAEFDKIKAS